MRIASSPQASKLLGVSVDNLTILKNQGVVHAVNHIGKGNFYSVEEINNIKSRPGLTISDEASQLDTDMRRKLTSSVSSMRKILAISGGMLLLYIFLVLACTTLFMIVPVRTAEWLGFISEKKDEHVLGISSAVTDRGTAIQRALLQPVGRASLALVKNLRPTAYAQVSTRTILDTNDVLNVDESGAIIPERPIRLTESSLLKIESTGLIENLNTQYLQGKQPGSNPGDLAVIGADGTIDGMLADNRDTSIVQVSPATVAGLVDPTFTINTSGPLAGGGEFSLEEAITLSCPSCLVFPSAGIMNSSLEHSSLSLIGDIGSSLLSLGDAFTIKGGGISSISSAGSTMTVTSTEADTLATVTVRGATTSASMTLNGGVNTTTSTDLVLDSGTTGGILIGTGSQAKLLTIGNTVGSTGLQLNAGTGNIQLQVAGIGVTGSIQLGAGGSGSATPDLLVLDIKNSTGDPTGTNGAMYYNADTQKFRCFQNSVWENCLTISGTGADLLHAASYDTSEALVNVTAVQVTLGTVTVTPSTITGDIYVTGQAEVFSSNATDQPFRLEVETTNNCTGTTVGNALVTFTITSGASGVNDRGSLIVSGVIIDPGASAQSYSLCASTAAGDTDVGNWRIEAMVIDTGADVAEIYTTNDTSIEAGDVVSLDATLGTGMKKSQIAYDQQVLGIVSTRPGLVIGSVEKEGVNALPVALSGRVQVKVSTQNGSIAVGDYLTSSAVAGVAMKATHAGAIIGTAMSAYDADEVGKITVFVKNGSGIVASTEAKNNAGRAIIKTGESEIDIHFVEEYSLPPIVTASVNVAGDTNFDELPSYAVYDVTTRGFTIKLSNTTKFDQIFSWIAMD